MINKVKRTSDLHRTCKKIIGTSIACLSMIATLTVGSSTASADVDILQPKIVQAVAYVPEQTLSDKIKEEAVKYLGVPYVYGGTTTKGFDCSGFTQYVFKNVGVDLPRVASSQANIPNGITVSKDNIQAGDLLFFSYGGGGIGHVGIALDDGKYVHASTGGKRILIANRAGTPLVKAVRVN